ARRGGYAEVAALELREAEHVRHHAPEPRRLLAHALRVVGLLRAVAEATGEHVAVELEARERRAELVGRRGCELAALAREARGARAVGSSTEPCAAGRRGVLPWRIATRSAWPLGVAVRACEGVMVTVICVGSGGGSGRPACCAW